MGETTGVWGGGRTGGVGRAGVGCGDALGCRRRPGSLETGRALVPLLAVVVMSIPDRLRLWMRSEWNAGRADQPLDAASVAAARRDLRASLESLRKQEQETLDEAQRWEDRAALAVRAGDDALARQALQKRDDAERRASEIRLEIARTAQIDAGAGEAVGSPYPAPTVSQPAGVVPAFSSAPAPAAGPYPGSVAAGAYAPPAPSYSAPGGGHPPSFSPAPADDLTAAMDEPSAMSRLRASFSRLGEFEDRIMGREAQLQASAELDTAMDDPLADPHAASFANLEARARLESFRKQQASAPAPPVTPPLEDGPEDALARLRRRMGDKA